MEFGAAINIKGRSFRTATCSLSALLLTCCSSENDVAGSPTTDEYPAINAEVAAEHSVSAKATKAESVPAASDPDDATKRLTVSGNGTAIDLAPLSAADIVAAKLSGELACSFSNSPSLPILFAKGNVASRDASEGIVKLGDYVERVAAPGGFDSMSKGVTYKGAGKTIRIELTGPAVGDGESPSRRGTLTYDRADGARRTLPGLWSCGP